MIMGPLAAWLMKQVDKLWEGKIKDGFEMLVRQLLGRHPRLHPGHRWASSPVGPVSCRPSSNGLEAASTGS
jgi:hypothetical protein